MCCNCLSKKGNTPPSKAIESFIALSVSHYHKLLLYVMMAVVSLLCLTNKHRVPVLIWNSLLRLLHTQTHTQISR